MTPANHRTRFLYRHGRYSSVRLEISQCNNCLSPMIFFPGEAVVTQAIRNKIRKKKRSDILTTKTITIIDLYALALCI